MSNGGGSRTRRKQHGAVLLGLAGGMLVVAGGFVGGYYVHRTRSVASADTNVPQAVSMRSGAPADIASVLQRPVDLATPYGSYQLTWAQLGAEIDQDEAKRVDGDLSKLAAKGQIPVRIDREKAIQALLALKPRTDRSPVDAYLDLEKREIHDDLPGAALDVFGSLPRLVGAARSGATKVDLAIITLPAAMTKAKLGIDDISHVLGSRTTHFPPYDTIRNFNLKLAASKINGAILRPGVEWSFNDTVGERSEKEGYKVAHVISGGEMVDGLAGGTCQISTTLFGAAFFAGIDIVKTTNHSRPSVYTPLGFDATVVWPKTDLKIKNPYDFPVAVRYVVANGEATVEILGKARPWDKITFAAHIFERNDNYPKEERPDPEYALDETSIDQDGFPGIKLMRYRHFYKGGEIVKTDKWQVEYPPVTEYIRKGTNPDPDAKHFQPHENHGPVPPSGDDFSMTQ